MYAPLGAVNVGVAGDVTEQTIDRLNSGYIDNLRPRVIILNIGNNDLAVGGKDEDYVVGQIGKILEILQSKFPNVKIILLQILPRGQEIWHRKARSVNGIIRKLYDDAYGGLVHYLDMEKYFCTSLGQVIPSLYLRDQLHLSFNGYRVWAQAMSNLFNKVFHSQS